MKIGKAVSIHAPRVGCDIKRYPLTGHANQFQFTHPVWGATIDYLHQILSYDGFNSRTPCGVRLRIEEIKISPTSVSIHAPRVGCDDRGDLRSCRCCRFNSRTPCGVRPDDATRAATDAGFQFTHPVWGATHRACGTYSPLPVSIHAPRVGCDVILFLFRRLTLMFQFTHPVWGATWHRNGINWPISFQFTHPVWGATVSASMSCRSSTFQFTHPVWGATQPRLWRPLSKNLFQFTHPVWGATFGMVLC